MRLFRRLQYLLHRNRREQELAEELAFHRTLAEREQRDSGIAPVPSRRGSGDASSLSQRKLRIRFCAVRSSLSNCFRDF